MLSGSPALWLEGGAGLRAAGRPRQFTVNRTSNKFDRAERRLEEGRGRRSRRETSDISDMPDNETEWLAIRFSWLLYRDLGAYFPCLATFMFGGGQVLVTDSSETGLVARSYPFNRHLRDRNV